MRYPCANRLTVQEYIQDMSDQFDDSMLNFIAADYENADTTEFDLNMRVVRGRGGAMRLLSIRSDTAYYSAKEYWQ